jgi:acyl-lipid (8-3)-desaturase
VKKTILLVLILPAAACAILGHSRAKTYTPEEIAAHNSENDCWFSIRGRVYDVTKFIPHHPGGRAILEACGKDATVLFETRPMGSGKPHSFLAKLRARSFRIGGLSAARGPERLP